MADTKSMTRILLLTLLTACAATEPTPLPLNPELASPADTDRAQALARELWSEYVGELPEQMPAVSFYEGCLVYAPEHMKPEWYHGCIGGRYFSDSDIHLDMSAEGDAMHSPIAHEMLHWALDMSTGEPDADHTDPLWDAVPDVAEQIVTTYTKPAGAPRQPIPAGNSLPE